MSSIAKSPTLKLIDGNEMPMLGLGVYKVGDEVAEPLVSHALEVGYRMIDTASMYENERGVGNAISNSTIPREEIFLTTKFWLDDLGYDKTLVAFEKSLKLLGLEYLDLYLIHWPAPKRGPLYLESWRAMERLVEEGRVNSIGVSNFHTHHLDEIFRVSGTTPVVNQVELHPWLTQQKNLAYNNQHGIVTQAWSPLARGQILGNELLTQIARSHSKSPAQIVLRWHLQRGTSVIPKSNSSQRIAENIDVFDFELSESDMRSITGLNSGFRTGLDPEDRN